MVHDFIVENGIASAPHGKERHERRDAAAHRQRILAVARDLFAREGVAAVTMHQIAKAAGIGQGTLYRRYANKGELCHDLMHERHEQFLHELRTYLTDAFATPALTKLHVVIERLLHFVSESMALLETMMTTAIHEMNCADAPDDAQDVDLRMEWFTVQQNLIKGLLREAVTRGEIAPLDVDYTADLLLSAMNPISLHFQLAERGYSLERIAAGLQHIFIIGIRPTAALTTSTADED